MRLSNPLAPLAASHTGTRLHHALSLDDLLRDLNHKLQQQAAQQQQQGGGGAKAAHVGRSALINALRQLDDVVVYDELTNTVRSVNRPGAQGAVAAKEAEVAAAQAAEALAA